MSFLVAGTAAVSLISGGMAAGRAAKAQRLAEAEEKKKRAEMDRLKGVYANLDTSNPFLNMENQYTGLENTMEDLTVNQQQAQFESQQFQQSQANIMSGLRGSAGGSGVAALAQTLAQQGQLNAQRSSASIGRQESANQMATAREASRLQSLEAGEASRIQGMERRGEVMSRNMKRDQTGTLLGMSQQETAAARKQAQMAEQAKWSAISSGIQGAVGAVGSGMQSGAFSEWGIPGIGND